MLQQATQFASEPSPDATQVEVLPQTARSFDGSEVKNPFASESLGDIRLTGVISNSNGKGTAIIEADGASYIVSTGNTLPESSWVVERVGPNSVTFSNEDSEKTIYMDSQNNGAKVG
jgi:Tfp pilus assembly protein PilP